MSDTETGSFINMETFQHPPVRISSVHHDVAPLNILQVL